MIFTANVPCFSTKVFLRESSKSLWRRNSCADSLLGDCQTRATPLVEVWDKKNPWTKLVVMRSQALATTKHGAVGNPDTPHEFPVDSQPGLATGKTSSGEMPLLQPLRQCRSEHSAPGKVRESLPPDAGSKSKFTAGQIWQILIVWNSTWQIEVFCLISSFGDAQIEWLGEAIGTLGSVSTRRLPESKEIEWCSWRMTEWCSNSAINLPKPSWLVVSNIFHFHPYLGKIPILTNIFQRGWHHQLARDFLPHCFWTVSTWEAPIALGTSQFSTLAQELGKAWIQSLGVESIYVCDRVDQLPLFPYNREWSSTRTQFRRVYRAPLQGFPMEGGMTIPQKTRLLTAHVTVTDTLDLLERRSGWFHYQWRVPNWVFFFEWR